MRKRILIASILSAGVLLTGCGSNNFRDVKGVPSRDPDSIAVYNNVDANPNIAKLCIDGVGFATTTRDYNSIMRVPDWDAECKLVQKQPGK